MAELEKRYHALHHGLHDAYGVSVGETKGAMYGTVLINPIEFEDLPDSNSFAIALQREENVLVFPGDLFKGQNFVRLVICCEIELIEEFCVRMKRFTLRHKKHLAIWLLLVLIKMEWKILFINNHNKIIE